MKTASVFAAVFAGRCRRCGSDANWCLSAKGHKIPFHAARFADAGGVPVFAHRVGALSWAA